MKLKRLAALVLTGVLCVTTLFGCGAKAEDTIATLGEEKVSFGVANFLVKYQKSTADDMYAMYAQMYGVDSMWDLDMTGAGSTAEDEFKAEAMNLLHEMYTLKAHMADYGVEITEDDKAAITEAANAFLAANSEEAIKEFGATEDIVTELLTLYTIQAKMYEAITADTDRVVSDEEANMRGYSMIFVSTQGEYDESYNWVEYTAEEIETIKSKVLQMGLDTKVKPLEEVAMQYGYEVTTDAYEKADATLDANVLKALDAMKVGEVSDAVETSTGYYFLRVNEEVDKDATEQNRLDIIAERELAVYEDVLAKLQENDGWKVNDSVVDKIEFHNMFTQYKESEQEESTETADVSETVDGTEN